MEKAQVHALGNQNVPVFALLADVIERHLAASSGIVEQGRWCVNSTSRSGRDLALCSPDGILLLETHRASGFWYIIGGSEKETRAMALDQISDGRDGRGRW